MNDAIISPPATSSCKVPITTAAVPCPLVIPILAPGCRPFSVFQDQILRASEALRANIPDFDQVGLTHAEPVKPV